ncbi:MAG TPA: Nramp family divalent metal transporter, partial [Gemmataceae bacterium]|nr:Nramp family divalent metal transporter [Gemmataceae bacterium]
RGGMAVDPKAQSGDSIVTGNDDTGSATGAGKADALEREPSPVRRFLKMLGPGLITGASDDDPSGIGTYAVAGAQLGYAALWTALVTFPLMAAVQFICARIAMVSGRGIASVLRKHYPRTLLYAVVLGLLLANTLNAGADLVAIAAGLNLLLPIPIKAVLVPVAILILVLQIWGSYRLIARTFKWLTLALFAFIGAAFLARPDWGEVFRGTVLPTVRFDSTFLATLVAILGTTISPYLFFWQASQEVEEEIARGRRRLWQRRGTTDGELRYAAWDVSIGMFLSNVVMYFIILATAATLHREGRTNIDSAAEAAEALRPLAGEAATVLMALGLIGTGFLAVPILTGSAAYAVCETFGWKCSLDAKPGKAKEFYLVLAASTIGGLVINVIGISPMDALFWTAVLNGFLSPPLLLVIMLIANNKQVMGNRVNGMGLNVLGWATTAAMFAAAAGLLLTWGKV